MAQATDGETNQCSNQICGPIFFQKDLLQRLMAGKCSNNKEPSQSRDEEPGDVELNLGLSLGGCFAGEKKENKLVRSSSIANQAMVCRLPEPMGLARSCSVPANLLPESPERLTGPEISVPSAEDRRRRRKELHALKRKRWIGLEGCRVKDQAAWAGNDWKQGESEKGKEESCKEDKAEDEKGTLTLTVMWGKREGCPGPEGWQTPQHGIEIGMPFPYMVPGTARAAGLNHNGKTGAFMPVASCAFVHASHASLGSQGSSSSALSEFESKSAQGLNGNADSRSPASVQSLPDQCVQKVIPETTGKFCKPSGEAADNPAKKRKMSNGERIVMDEMPCVSTRGDGPNGKRIEGFLYNYPKGEEEVIIVCVCHGSFLSPAEFVKHAGGGEVAHPLRHIVVNPSPFFL